MLIEFVSSGGFAGLTLHYRADTDALGDTGEELEGLVADAGLWDRATTSEPSSPLPDVTHYTIRVDEAGRTARVTFDDTTAPPQARPLLRRLRELALEQRRGHG